MPSSRRGRFASSDISSASEGLKTMVVNDISEENSEYAGVAVDDAADDTGDEAAGLTTNMTSSDDEDSDYADNSDDDYDSDEDDDSAEDDDSDAGSNGDSYDENDEEIDTGSVVVHNTSTASSSAEGDSSSSPISDERRSNVDAHTNQLPAFSGGTLTRRKNSSAAVAGDVQAVADDGNAGVPPRSVDQAAGGAPVAAVAPAAVVPPAAQRPIAVIGRAMQAATPGAAGGGGLADFTYSQLDQLLVTLNNDLETELRNLTIRYRHKRQPLLDAIAEKTAQRQTASTTSAGAGSTGGPGSSGIGGGPPSGVGNGAQPKRSLVA